MKYGYKNLYVLLLSVITLALGIGYAAINSISLNLSGLASAVPQQGVFITDVQYNYSTSVDVSLSKINSFYGTNVSSYIKLNNDPYSEITYTISVYNSTDQSYYFDGALYLETDDGSTYSNSNIGYRLSGIDKSDVILSKKTLSFDVTFYYLDSKNIVLTDLTSLINYKFSPLFADGQVVYFDVSKGTGCTMEEYASSYDSSAGDFRNSLTEYNGLNGTGNQNGCLLFYAFNDDGSDELNLILDHNLKASTYWTNSTTSSNKNGPITAINELKTATSSWKGTQPLTDYTVLQTGYGNYTIPYATESYKARLITAQEVAKIVGADEDANLKFNENEKTSVKYFFLDSLSTTASSTCKNGNTSGCKYGWLYDRTRSDCENYGCYNNCEVSTYGYWTGTSSFGYSAQAWSVDRDGSLYSSGISNKSYGGVRPVIRVLKNQVVRGKTPVAG